MSETIKKIITIETKGSDGIKKMRSEMKSLRSELLSLEKGTTAYNDALKRLSTITRDYADLNLAIRNSAQDWGQALSNITKATQGVVGGFNALNGVLTLFGSASEDVQKTILKLQAGISIVQGLGALEKLTKVLPALAYNFKGLGEGIGKFFDSFFGKIDPFEKKVNNIAKTLNDMSVGDINVNASATASANSGVSTNIINNTGVVGPLKAETAARESNNKAIAATNKEQDKLYARRQREADALVDTNTALNKTIESQEKLNKAYENATKIAGKYKINIDEIKTSYKDLGSLKSGSVVFLNEKQRKELDNALTTIRSYDKLTQNTVKDIDRLSTAQLEAKKAIEKTDAAIEKASTSFGKAILSVKNFVKAVASTTALTLAVVALTTLITKLWNMAQKANAARKEAKELRLEIEKGASGASKQIVALQQLSRSYKQLGDDVKAKEQFIKDFADKIKETGVAIYDVNSAEEVFRNNTAAYITALKERAKAQAAEQLAIKKYQEYLEKRAELENELTTNQSKKSTAQTALDNLNKAGLGGQEMAGPSKALSDAEKAISDAQNALTDLDGSINKTMDNLFDVADAANAAADASLKPLVNAENAAKEAQKAAAEAKKTAEANAKAAAEAAKKQKEDELKELEKGYNAIVDLRKTQEQKEIEAVNSKYDRLLELAKKYGMDTAEIENARQAELKRIRDAADQKAIEDYEKAANERWETFQKELERTRKLNDTKNLKEPREQTYQTNYTQGISYWLGLGGKKDAVDSVRDKGTRGTFVNTYQSKQNIEDQYNKQVEYNNQLLELTQSRINAENELITQQLDNEALTADQREELQRQLAENEMALSDAVLDNEQANLIAYKKVQEAKQQALNATIEVASSVTGTLATLFQQEMQMSKKKNETDEEAEKRQKDALKAYKIFATAQAVMDTYKAANEAYAAMASIPYVGPGLGIAAAAAAIASGIANVKQIQQTQLTASSSITSSSSVATPVAMTQAPIAYTKEILGDRETDNTQTVKCYILENEISLVQNKVAVREANASF